jgi:hypothetical protein
MSPTENRRLHRFFIATLVVLLSLLSLFVVQQWIGTRNAVQPVLAYQPAITITPTSRSINIQAGTSTILTHTITNTGDQAGSFNIATSSNQSLFTIGFVFNTNPFTKTLNPGESVTVNIDVSVSGAAPANTVGSVQLLVVLTTDTGNNASASNTLTVVNPTLTPTPTRTPTPIANIYADTAEPNNAIADATDYLVGNGQRCSLTLWPVGDVDYYKFYARTGSVYQITTDIKSPGLDTFMRVYDSNFNVVGTNDNYQDLGGNSQFVVTAGWNGYYFVEITNVNASNPAGKTYCIDVTQVVPTATPTPELLQTDPYENNGSFDLATLIGEGVGYSANFVPPIPPGPDNDFYQLWVKPGIYYTCETLDLSPVTDTNMILYDQNYNGLAGNDDKAPGDLGSLVQYYSTYTGWLYILVGPYQTPVYEESPEYTYVLQCDADASTPTPTATATATLRPPTTGGGGGNGSTVATPTLIPSPTPSTKGTPDFVTPSPTPRPNIVFEPLPTPTTIASGAQFAMLTVTVYYDENENFTAEQSEGVMNVQVSLFDSVTGEWLAFGYTNEAGMVQFGPFEVNGPILVTVPYLGFSQTVPANTGALEVRISPQTLPNGIP